MENSIYGTWAGNSPEPPFSPDNPTRTGLHGTLPPSYLHLPEHGYRACSQCLPILPGCIHCLRGRIFNTASRIREVNPTASTKGLQSPLVCRILTHHQPRSDTQERAERRHRLSLRDCLGTNSQGLRIKKDHRRKVRFKNEEWQFCQYVQNYSTLYYF